MSVIRQASCEFHDINIFTAAAAEIGCTDIRVAKQKDDVVKPITVKVWNKHVEAVASAKLPEWSYPIAVTADGNVTYDNHEGGWGNIEELSKLKQAYSEKYVTRRVQETGQRIVDRRVVDGQVRLTVSR